MKFRIKQEGCWFYPEHTAYFMGFPVGWTRFEYWPGKEHYFGSLADARKFLDDFNRPPTPPAPITIHKYP
jgi:hypothetical protein